MYPIHAYVHTYIHTYTGTYKSGACTQRFERSIHGVKTRGMNRGKNTPAFFASLSRSCRHGIENYPPPPSFAPLRSSLLILSCLHFRERLFLLAVDLSVPSSFFNTEIYFLLSYSHETTPSPPRAAHRCTTDLSLSLSRFLESNNRLRHSFFSSSSMNLCLQQLCKKKGGTGKKKRKEKNIESFRGRNLAYRNPMHLIRSLFLFSSSSTRKNLASKRFNRWIFRVASTGVARRSDSLSLLPAKFVK